MFSIKFKTAELANEFKDAYDSFRGDAASAPKAAPAPKSGGFNFGAPTPAPAGGDQPKPVIGFGTSAPPKNETPQEMVQRLEREKMNADIAKAASSGKFTFGVAASGGGADSGANKTSTGFGASLNNTGFGASTGFGFGNSTNTGATSSGNKTFSFGVSAGQSDAPKTSKIAQIMGTIKNHVTNLTSRYTPSVLSSHWITESTNHNSAYIIVFRLLLETMSL